jgi:AmmeMemoRadiSam system protein B
VEKQRISACGYGPIATLITCAKGLNVKEAKLLAHRTSGEITNDLSSVVGYAAVSFEK